MRLLKFGHLPGSSNGDTRNSNNEDTEEKEIEIEINICNLQTEQLPPYAILSHRWGHVDDEVSFGELVNRNGGNATAVKQKKGYKKIESCCRQALRDGLSYAWIDTCCINKDSSAELSEAINSMYEWYRRSKVCYVYLEDVHKSVKGKEKKIEEEDDDSSTVTQFRNSKWFTRGWTLQELIAPKDVRFFTADWVQLGRKRQPRIARLLSQITGIPADLLLGKSKIKDICASQILFWASKRQTTRTEDRTYSLLGLFDISFPILYGEGSRAFRRLQEEIVRKNFDHTIFAWSLEEEGKTYSGLLAKSPDAFARSGSIRKMPFDKYSLRFDFGKGRMNYSLTNAGIQISLPYHKLYGHLSVDTACIACIYAETGTAVLIFLRHLDRPTNHFFRTITTSGSLCALEDVIRNSLSWNNLNNNFTVVEPERFLASGSILPLIPNDIATDNTDISTRDIKCYQVTLFIGGGSISTVDPMPHSGGTSKITFETEAELVWVATIESGGKPMFKVFLAIVDRSLRYHLESLIKDEPSNVPTLLTSADADIESIDEYVSFRCDTFDEEKIDEDSEDDNHDDDNNNNNDNIIKYPIANERKWSYKSFSSNPCTRLNLGIDRDGKKIKERKEDGLEVNIKRISGAVGVNPNRLLYNLDIEVASEKERREERDPLEDKMQSINEKVTKMTGGGENVNEADEADDRAAVEELNRKIFKPSIEKVLQEEIVDDIEKRFSKEINQFLDSIDKTLDGYYRPKETEPPPDDGIHLSYLPPPGSDLKPNWCVDADINFTFDKKFDDHGRPFGEAAIVQYIYDNFPVVCDSARPNARKRQLSTTDTAGDTDGTELAEIPRTLFYIVTIDGDNRLFRTCL